MRLGQLARKLSLRPSEIKEFLAARNIEIEEGSNTKIDDNHVSLIIQQFAPTMQRTVDLDASVQEEQMPTPDIPPTETEILSEKPLETESRDASIEAPDEKPEVIKAPKVELSGLKVLGKIELPEPKKKSSEIATEENIIEGSAKVEEPVKKGAIERKSVSPRREFRGQRSSKNPIAVEREQEALEAKKKREVEAERQKEKRTQNYLKKVKTVQPTKATKIIKEETEQMSAAELEEPPKTWWGKLVRWLTT